MLAEEPRWMFASSKPLTRWYGHVHLLPNHVVGQWFCVDRLSGQVKWQLNFGRPNTITAVNSDVIVASEMRSDGPWTASFGCYGICLDTGQLLWKSHRSGFWGRFVRLLDFVPGFTNDLRDTPHHVEDGKVYCQSGRVLDARTGQTLQKVDPEIIRSHEKPISLGQQFYDSGLETDHPRVAIGDGLFLRHVQATKGKQRGVLEISAQNKSANSTWRFSVEQFGRHIDGNFYSYRLVPPFIYFVVSDEPRYKPHPTKEHYVLPNPTLWHVISIALETGKIVQDFSLGSDKLEECRIEDVDDRGLLIGKSSRELLYFERVG